MFHIGNIRLGGVSNVYKNCYSYNATWTLDEVVLYIYPLHTAAIYRFMFPFIVKLYIAAVVSEETNENCNVIFCLQFICDIHVIP